MSGGGAGEHFRLWLRAGLSGCEFAKLLASKAHRMAIEHHVDALLPTPERLNSTFDENGKADRAVAAVFPMIADEIALIEFLNVLGADARWRVVRRSKTSPSGGVLVGLEWRTAMGDTSHTMGFAPFLTMPVSRRAPYVAIATWPGGHMNPRRGEGKTPPPRDGEVSFLDAKHDLEPGEYHAKYDETEDKVRELMSAPPDDASLYRRTAFVISSEHADKLIVEQAV